MASGVNLFAATEGTVSFNLCFIIETWAVESDAAQDHNLACWYKLAPSMFYVDVLG